MDKEQELSYVLVTPHSIRKSRTGGIVSRLLSRTGLDLVRARLFAPGKALIDEYAGTIVTDAEPRHQKTQALIRDYIYSHLLPNPDIEGGRQPLAMLLVLQGPRAVEKVRTVVGHIVNERTAGETIRDTYGDYVTDANGNVIYFEPAVLAPPTPEAAELHLKLFARYSDSDGGIFDQSTFYPDGANVEKTLVLIKPDNFRYPNARPGGVIDLFSWTGLTIIGMKVHHMSVAQAMQFYGPVLDTLKNLYRTRTGEQARAAIERELGFPIDEATQQALGDLLGPIHGTYYWETLVAFMTGRRPSDCTEDLKHAPGTEKCLALVYQGVYAVAKIRAVLGPTDPSKAPTGTIRKEFGQSIMVNAAHASDSAENAARELGIIQIEENNLKPFVESFYATKV